MSKFNSVKKWITMLVVACLSLVSLQGLVYEKVNADGTTTVSSEIDSGELANAEQYLANELEFMFSKALTVDSEGYTSSVNMSMLESRYGNSKELSELKSTLAQNAHASRSWGRFTKCVMSEFGVTAAQKLVKKVFSKKTLNLLKKKSWKKAAQEIIYGFKKYGSKKLFKRIVKKLATKAIPEGFVADVIWVVVKCRVTSIL